MSPNTTIFFTLTVDNPQYVGQYIPLTKVQNSKVQVRSVEAHIPTSYTMIDLDLLLWDQRVKAWLRSLTLKVYKLT